MAKLRLLFTKEAQASYISHLDTMRTFQRVFPRAELHLKHSNGFHPHPIISIVLPLPVGQSSDCELLDFETVEETDGAGIAEKLNTGLPAGLRVRECYPVTRPVREFTFLRARLELLYDNGVPAGTADALRALFARETLMIEKRTKHKELAQIDIAPLMRNDPHRAGRQHPCRRRGRRAEPGAEPCLSRTGDRARASGAQAGLRPCAPHGNLRYRGERFPLKIARAAATLDDFIEKYKICACNLAKSVILSFLAF